MNKRKKVGLALGSGGVRGFAHVGVIKTLVNHNIPIDYISGCSIGSWVGAHYALYKDVDRLEKETVGRYKEKIKVFWEPTIQGGVVKGDKLEKLIDSWLNYSEFSHTQIPFRAVATDLISGQSYTFHKGRLAQAVRASMSIPTLFKPLDYKNKLLVDGGISNPVPDEIVRKKGADIVISVNLDSQQKNKHFNQHKLNLARTSQRSLNLLRYYLAQYSIQSSDFVLEPASEIKDDLGFSAWKDYFSGKTSQSFADKLVAAGVKETEKIVPKLKKQLQ